MTPLLEYLMQYKLSWLFVDNKFKVDVSMFVRFTRATMFLARSRKYAVAGYFNGPRGVNRKVTKYERP